MKGVICLKTCNYILGIQGGTSKHEPVRRRARIQIPLGSTAQGRKTTTALQSWVGNRVFRERQTSAICSQKVNKMLRECVENRLVLVVDFDSRKLKGKVLQIGTGAWR